MMIAGTLALAIAYTAVGVWAFQLRKTDETEEIKAAKEKVMELVRQVCLFEIETHAFASANPWRLS